MDTLVALTPAQYLPYVTAAVAVCAVAASALPHPVPGASGVYARVYAVVNFVACNFGKAKNAPAVAVVAPIPTLDTSASLS